MNFISSERLREVSPIISEELSKWMKEEYELDGFDLVELFWDMTEEVIKKHNLEIQPQITSKVMMYLETQEQIETLHNIGVKEFRIVPLFTEKSLRDFVEYRLDGKMGIVPFLDRYEIYILNNETNEISVRWTVYNESMLENLWEIACLAASI